MADPWYVYIALLEDGRFYTGITHHDPADRADMHRQGKGGSFTLGIRIVRVLWQELHPSTSAARKRESQIKRWSHAKKEALIKGDWRLLKKLSRSRKV